MIWRCRLFDEAGAEQTWKILYIVQSPEYLAICRMVEVPTDEPAPVGESILEIADGSHGHGRTWKLNFGKFESAASMPERDIGDVWVLPQVLCTGGSGAKSMRLSTPLRTFLETLPEAKPAANPEKKARTSKNDSFEDALAKLPWLQHLEKGEWDASCDIAAASSSREQLGALAMGESVELEEETVFAAVELMEKARVALAAEPGAHREDFGTRIRKVGAGSSIESYDAAQAVARNELARGFCIRRATQSTFRASYNLDTTPEEVGVLIRGWIHKMQWFFNLELSHPLCEKLVFGPAVHLEYQEPIEFTALANATPKKRTMDRIVQIRGLLR